MKNFHAWELICNFETMGIMGKGTLRTFWETIDYKDAEPQLKSWYAAITYKDWQNPNEIINAFQNTDTVGNNRLI